MLARMLKAPYSTAIERRETDQRRPWRRYRRIANIREPVHRADHDDGAAAPLLHAGDRDIDGVELSREVVGGIVAPALGVVAAQRLGARPSGRGIGDDDVDLADLADRPRQPPGRARRGR